MDRHKLRIVLGPPGTGKTTWLLNVVKDLLKEKVSPWEIAFLAFTRKAANEAKERALQEFGYDESKFPWFRTLHSLAFRQLGIRSQDIMNPRDYFNVAGSLGLFLTLKGIQEDGRIVGQSKGDRLLFMENMARATKKDLKTYWEEVNEDIPFNELEQVSETMKIYKESRGKLDFTDLLVQFIEEGAVPHLKVLIVDEAQDLTSLQWDAIDLLAKTPSRIYLAGDDDQAIFRWAGADVDTFISLQGAKEVLPLSYRVPSAIQSLGSEVISRVSNRIPKEWKPRKKGGTVNFITQFEELDLHEGTWLLLARNIYLLEDYVIHCLHEGYLFESITQSALSNTDSLRAIRSWEALRRGERISVDEANHLYGYLSPGKGAKRGSKKRLAEAPEARPLSMLHLCKEYGLLAKGEWHQALDRITYQERKYYEAAEEKGEVLVLNPRIKISTIHGVKGGEADNVVLMSDMAHRTYQEFEANPDDEHRVWYVGITRAKENLFILPPTSLEAYQI